MWSQGVKGESELSASMSLYLSACSRSSQANVLLNHSAYFKIYQTIRALQIQNRRTLPATSIFLSVYAEVKGRRRKLYDQLNCDSMDDHDHDVIGGGGGEGLQGLIKRAFSQEVRLLACS